MRNRHKIKYFILFYWCYTGRREVDFYESGRSDKSCDIILCFFLDISLHL